MGDFKFDLEATSQDQAQLSEGLNVELGNGITLLYTTPLLRFTVPQASEINGPLTHAILEREKMERGVTISNTGGWQSKTDFLEWPVPAIDTLKGAIAEALRRMSALSPELAAIPAGKRQLSAYGWANVNRDSHYNRLHSHPGSHWSGVYYVDTGSSDPNRPDNGIIELHDPRHLSASLRIPGFRFGQQVSVQPFPGLMLLFPSWLEHWVTPFHGTGQRISIAFNIQLQMPSP